jgi:WD40 repeat protein
VVVDQFEEVFAAGVATDARRQFIDALLQASADADNPLMVAVVMRADFYGSCAQHEVLARALTQSQVLVAAMTDAELRRAVVEPALRAGLTIEDGLAETISTDAAGEPGALPLVSTALLETWVRRSNDRLTLAGYADAGGVHGAVARLANGVYEATDETGRAIIRRIFLRLADPEGPTDDVRRRARRDEVATTEAEQKLLTQLISRRLVTATEDTVEVAHEALLREWPRLRGWLAQDREGRRLHRQLADAAAAWDAEGRDEAGLYRGTRLQAALDTAAAGPDDFTPLERAFLTESEYEADRQLTEQRARADREARGRRRARLIAAGLGIALAAAAAAGGYAITKQRQAQRAALAADVSRLATLARTLPDDQRDLALLLGAQGYRMRPSDESIGGLQAAVAQTPPGLQRVMRYRSTTLVPALDRTGRMLAVPGADGTVTIANVVTGKVMRTLTYPRPRQFAAFSGDSNLVAAGGFDGTIAVWDVRTGQRSGAPLDVGGGTAWPAFDPTDDARLYAVSHGEGLTAWDRHDPAHPRQIRQIDAPGVNTNTTDAAAITVSPNGRLVAVGLLHGGGAVNVVNASTSKVIQVVPGSPGIFGADGVTLPIFSGDRITLYNALTGHPGRTFTIPGGAPLARLSGDGRWLAVAQSTGVITVYDVRSGAIIGTPLKLHANTAFPVGFLPDGQLVTSDTQEAGIWTLGGTLPPIGRSLPAPGDYDWPIFMPDQREVVTRGRGSGRLLRHDAVTGAILGPLLGGRVGPDFAASPDDTLLVAPAKDHSGTAIWRTATGDRLGALTDVPDDAALAWSPAGHLVATATPTSVQLWDVHDPAHPLRTAVVPTVRGLGAFATPILTFSRDGSLLEKSASDDNGMTMIDVASHSILWSKILTDVSLSQAGSSVSLAQTAISPDGKTLAVDFGDVGTGRVTLYNARTGQPRATIATQSSGGVSYLHKGKWLVTTGGDTNPGAQVYDTQTLQPIGVPLPIKHVAGDEYTPGDPYRDVFNYGIGFPVAANNLGTLFAAGEPNAPVLWDVDPNHWQTIACTIAGRNLSHAEWHTYLPNLHYQRTCPQWPAGS